MTTTVDTTTDVYATRVSGDQKVVDRDDPVVWGGTGDGPLAAEDLSTFGDNGYLAIDQLVRPEEVEGFRAELRRLSADPKILEDERSVVERQSNEVRSIFEVHKISDVFADIVNDPRVVGRARQLLGSDVYVHQSRVNFKPGFDGKEFYWHSDFETWHAEDGMPRMRAVSISISLTDNHAFNGPLMIIPGSHRSYVSCSGATPDDNYKSSLVQQQAGTPDHAILTDLADRHGIDVLTGSAGGATMFDCNCMHGSNGNITPFARSNVFIVFNSVENTCVEPFAAERPRPPFIGARDFTPVG
ncbi:MAG: ectoine hydroxylase [Nocardioidaceae bacterium]